MNENTSPKELKSVVVKWIILQVIYNVVLFAFGLSASYELMYTLGPKFYLPNVVLFGMIANAFFLLGPVLELYLLAFEVKIGRFRYAVFVVGLLFALLTVEITAQQTKGNADNIKKMMTGQQQTPD